MTYEALIRMKRELRLICFKRRNSCWKVGVNKYAGELMEDLIESRRYNEVEDVKSLRTVLMRGADSWLKYSRGGFGLVSCYEIAKRLCNKSEFKKCMEGMLQLNPYEDWDKVEARALTQAFELVKQAFIYASMDIELYNKEVDRMYSIIHRIARIREAVAKSEHRLTKLEINSSDEILECLRKISDAEYAVRAIISKMESSVTDKFLAGHKASLRLRKKSLTEKGE